MIKNLMPTNEQFIANYTADVVNEIVHNNIMSFNKASDSFLHSKSYYYLKDQPELYYHEEPEYFYDIWKNEQKYDRAVPSYILELEGIL